MWQKLLVLLWISCIAASAYAGSNELDSLKGLFANARQDTTKVNLLLAIAKVIPDTDSANKMQYAYDALEIAQGAHSGKHLMDCYQSLGQTYCYSYKNYQLARDYFQQYESKAQYSRDTIRQIDALSNLVGVSYFLYEYVKELAYGNRALQLRPSKNLEAGVLGNIGRIYLAVDDYPKAMEYYTRSLKAKEQDIIAKKNQASNDDTMHLTMLLMNIADIYGGMKEYDKAIANYDRAISIAHNERFVIIMSLLGKGSIYENSMNFADAKKMYHSALEIDRQWQNMEIETQIFTALARLYFKTEDSKVAQTYSDTALLLAKKHKEKSMLLDIYIIQAQLDKSNAHYNSAVAYLQNAIKISRDIGILGSQRDALELLSETYTAMSQPAKALDAYQQYIVIRDSIFNTDKAKEITRMDIESKYTTIRLDDSVKNAQRAAVYEANIQKQRVVNTSVIIVAVLLVILAVVAYRSYTQQKKTNVVISKAHDETKKEKQVSEGLLLNILPEEVAKELKDKGDVEPKLFENVTVFFSDFVGFTIAADRMSPQELVAELHECFKAFDEIMSRYGIEKIKTVGDAYLAVSGLPEPSANHADNIVKAALEVRNFMVKRRNLLGDKTFGIRIGVNSGPVVAGIVGVRKFAYDIWGDTVNVAARMEQNSENGKINISEKTRERLAGKFELTDRGSINAKNKGAMRMYFVEEVQVLG